MNIEYFYYFAEAARLNSISKAAQNYHMSQQGLSRAIKQLEREYHVALFERRGNSVQLTKTGEIFLTEAEDIIATHNHLQERIANQTIDKKSYRPHVEILVTLNVAFNIWPALSEKLTKAFPDTIIVIKELPHEQIIKALCDCPSSSFFALMSIPEVPGAPVRSLPLEFEPILEVHLMARVGKSSRYAKREMISCKDLKDAPLILHDDPVLDRILESLDSENEDALEKTLLRTNNTEIMVDSLKRFDAIGFSNSFCYYYNRTKELEILPLEKDIRTPVYFVHNKMAEKSKDCLLIHDFITKVVEDDFPLVAYQADSVA